MHRDDIAAGIADALWKKIGGAGRTPKNLLQAGEDLVALYEEANDLPMEDVRLRLNKESHVLGRETLRTEGSGDWFTWAALGDAPEYVVELMHTAGVAVPSFSIRSEPAGYRGEMTVVWDGSPHRRNPGDAASYMMLLEDDPILQEGTGRWMKRMFPGTPLLVVDNVEAAIANLKHHEISLIVSDVDVVGNQNGIDLFHYVQSNYPELVDKYTFFTGNSAAEKEHYRYLAKGAATSKDLKAVINAPAPGGRSRTTTAKHAPTVQDVVAVVRDVAPSIRAVDGPDGKPKARFGDRKIFISALWREAGARLQGLSFNQFKDALIAAHRERLLQLARADLVAAMDNGAVMASEAKADGATFHFVVDPSFAATPAARPAIQIASPRTAKTPAARAGAPSTAELADAVLAALPSIRGMRDASGENARGRFGESKVFIGPIWKAVSRQYPDMTRGQFDHGLLVAQRDGLLTLARLDTRIHANADEVSDSEIDERGYVVHFVIDPSARW